MPGGPSHAAVGNLVSDLADQAASHQHMMRLLQAFLEASMKSEDELMRWFRDRLVWSDPGVVTELLKSGLFVRMYTPQVGHGIAWHGMVMY